MLVNIRFADGTSLTSIIRPSDPSFLINKFQQSALPVLDYLRLGIEHILFGIDHLLFVLALILIVKGTRRLIKTITAFTIAHSITLAAATLGWVHIPSAPVEAVIALSIIFLAVELVHYYQGKAVFSSQYPWVVAFIFGLLHGFGFAGALANVGLPQHEIPLTLFLFNVGVETGTTHFYIYCNDGDPVPQKYLQILSGLVPMDSPLCHWLHGGIMVFSAAGGHLFSLII